MAGKNGTLLQKLLPEQRIYIKSGEDDRTRYICVTPRIQALCVAAGLAVVCWSVVATSALLLGMVTADSEAMQASVIQDAQESRIAELSEERDQRAREATVMRERFGLALDEISSYQGRILEAEQSLQEQQTALRLMRDKLQEAITARDAASSAVEELDEELRETTGSLVANDGRRDGTYGHADDDARRALGHRVRNATPRPPHWKSWKRKSQRSSSRRALTRTNRNASSGNSKTL